MNNSRDVRDLLDRAAAGPVGPAPIAELVGRGARRRRTWQAGGVGLTAAVTAAVILIVTGVVGHTTPGPTPGDASTGPTGLGATARQIADGSWQSVPAAPIKTCGAARSVTASNNVVILVVSQDTPRCPSAAATYNARTNDWKKLTAPPASLRGQLTVSQDLYVSRATGDAAVLNPRTGGWRSLPAVPASGSLAALVSGTTQPIVIGAGPHHDQVFSFNGARWVTRPTLPHPGADIVALAAYSDGQTQWALATEERTTGDGLSSGLSLLRLSGQRWITEPDLPNRPAMAGSVEPIGDDRQLIVGSNCPLFASCPASGVELGIANLVRGRLQEISDSPLGVGLREAVLTGDSVVGLDTDAFVGSGGTNQPEIRPLASTVYDLTTGRWLPGPRAGQLLNISGMAWTPSGLVVLGHPAATCACSIGGLILRPATGHPRTTPSPYPTVSTTVPPPNLTPASWPTNASGQTYGSAEGITVPADLPDLVSVIATNGHVGYVRKAPYLAATQPSPPANPQVAATESPAQPTTLPVYAKNGITRIGVFVTGSA